MIPIKAVQNRELLLLLLKVYVLFIYVSWNKCNDYLKYRFHNLTHAWTIFTMHVVPKNTSSWFSRDSEADGSEFVENREEMFLYDFLSKTNDGVYVIITTARIHIYNAQLR